ncbi:voltage gated chloride channel [Myriangium duriaei CBS 260.36]|uniref:Chloride channel protein n=1 Tax=Myriangium duriaei CBS 260.36 TaxID=1168546 RepID=A0A9P4IUS2_9PEZI|nr:voltage gated chloride channel [Myriangium duriaei CBS 260.36]
MSSTSSSRSRHEHAQASSSRTPYIEDGEDDLDVTSALDAHQSAELLDSDPLNGHLDKRISFKRKQKLSSVSSRFLSSPFNSSNPPSRPTSARTQRLHRSDTLGATDFIDAPADGGLHDTKDATALDWYVEGPGRRVGYDDLTAIDWIFEYAKERQRQRVLRDNTNGLLGLARQFADSSQIWVILVATGVAVGTIAAGIDVVSDWLGDFKTGYCSNVAAGGRFYLNKYFCCWGLDDFSKCMDWRSWSTAMGIQAAAGSWVMNFIIFSAFSVLFATIASFLTNIYASYAKQSGIPEIKTVLGGFVIRRFLGAWTLAVKSIGLCLSVSSGLWLGKEGPLVHVACCCANLFMKGFDTINSNEARKREVLSAAAASGISVAFGSPVGGVLFSLESLSYYFPDKTMWQSFVCAMVAAFILQAYNPFRTGKLVMYQVTYHSNWHAFELVPFAIIGIMGGIYGGLYIKLNTRIARWRRSKSNPLRNRPVLEVVVVTAATAIISFPITFLRAQSTELVSYLLAECTDIQTDHLGLCKSGKANTGVIFLLLLSAIIGFFLAAITFGLQIPAGILLPSMAVGALYGRVVGLIVEVWQREHPNFLPFAACEKDLTCITPGTYAIVGAASALAGATRMTVSIVVIMFELTGALTYVLPIMVAVMIAKWVGDGVHSKGIYEAWIHLNGYPFLDNRDDRPAPDVPVSQIMTRLEDLIVLTATGHTVETLNNLLRSHTFRGFPVVNNTVDALLLGYISRTELEYALRNATSSQRALPKTAECYFSHQALADPSNSLDLRPWMDQTPITLSARANLQLAVNMFQRLGLRYLVFADRGILAGLLTKKDVWFVLNEGDIDAQAEESQATTISRGANLLREEGVGEGQGLLGADPADEEDLSSRHG